jgi:putative heme-binding domain-containing protein
MHIRRILAPILLAMLAFQSQIQNPKSKIAPGLALLLLTALIAVPLLAQDDPFAAGVRTTPWLSPADEQKLFKLPEGFEINLVAAEPEIQKPLNMAFDERGRIWLTCSVEYPYAAPADRPGRDKIMVLEDADGDGRYEKVQTFADGLNIPIGIYPWKGGCVAYSIPNIWHFEDTDSDGVCDKRTVLYGPFDTSRDTHGMVNSLRRGWDGWVYACHGFNNDSRVKGRDGHEIHMQSGNTFRFQLDGSRIEHFTHGQVNPFGMCFDGLFNIFTADCHSKPIYQLLRGGYYPSFGKPHDGLGFVPPMMDHLHGSTAICGLVCYSGENFPAEYQGNFLSGNVMTSRINRNKPEYHGSTIKAIEQPDFLTADDPWFRPVDLQIGPDGALYILDFYNRIIGHYEVPLTHPGRDRTSGRIWRVAYKGDNARAVGNALRGVPPDLTKLSVTELIAQLDSPQLEYRLRALSLIRDRHLDAASQEITEAWNSAKIPAQRASLIWLMRQLGRLNSEAYGQIVSDQNSPTELQVHALLSLSKPGSVGHKELAAPVYGLLKKESNVRRASAITLSTISGHGFTEDIITALKDVNADDPMLRQALRIALRNEMNSWNAAKGTEFFGLYSIQSAKFQNEVLQVASAASSAGASAFLLEVLDRNIPGFNPAAIDFQRVAKSIPESDVERLIAACRGITKDDNESEAKVVLAIQAGISQRGTRSESLTSWGQTVAERFLESRYAESIPWTAVPIEGKPASENPWDIAPRPSRDGDKNSLFYYSLPKGEQRTGIYRSGTFELPTKLSFWCAGHSGLPNQPLNDGNYVRLRDAKTHEILAESRPPRNDTARPYEWNLTEHAGKQGYVELADGDTANAYAWLAVGRFSHTPLNPSLQAGRQVQAAEIIGKLKLASFRAHLAMLIAGPATDGAARAAIGQALVALEPDSRAAALVAVLNDAAIPAELRPRMGYAITVRSDSEYLDNLREAMKRIPTRLQATLADTLAGDAAGAAALLALAESGHAAPRLLLLPNVSSKLGALKSAELDQRVSAITSKLPPASATLDALIVDRRRDFAKAATNLERGQAVFTKHCAACHQLEGKGAIVGPQLDGIGNRGLDRLLEDLLDPNRNVDVAFRTTTLRTTDGRVLSGLVRREEDQQLVLADANGKEFAVAKSEIDEQQKTGLSLMPANVGEVVSPGEFADLVAYLLGQRPTKRDN